MNAPAPPLEPHPQAASIQLYDYVSAVFSPHITTDFQYPETAYFIGHRLYWQASWIVEDGAYRGQMAMCVQPTADEERVPFVWAPLCDLAEIEQADGREVHTKTMNYLRKPSTAPPL